jgi:hypothetical protein
LGSYIFFYYAKKIKEKSPDFEKKNHILDIIKLSNQNLPEVSKG